MPQLSCQVTVQSYYYGDSCRRQKKSVKRESSSEKPAYVDATIFRKYVLEMGKQPSESKESISIDFEL